jgi:MoxR-like ATPase
MTSPEPSAPDPDSVRQRLAEVEAALNRVLLGKEDLVRDFLTGVLARGHLLLEGLPGLGKTQLVRAFGELCNLTTRRVQFTPDLMPLDITGSYILHERGGEREFEFHPGPLFGNLVLADEINRASPKTQSALLEAMQEHRATVLGHTHDLPEPFVVLATQNPIELEGTYPLPEAQLDRFLFKLEVTDVPAEVLTRVVTERGRGELPPLEPLLDRAELLAAMQAVDELALAEQVASYIARLVRATHGDGVEAEAAGVKYGASPRAALALGLAARARAFLAGRETVGFEDVRAVAPPTLRHRLLLDYNARLEGRRPDDVIQALLEAVPEVGRQTPPTVADRLAGPAAAG